MGITEDRNTPQKFFCFVCGGPGIIGWPDGRRVCAGCKRVLNSWNVHGRPTRAKAVSNATKVWRVTAEERLAYCESRRDFLQENMFCWVALLVFKRLERSTVVHHRKGRGKHLNDRSTFLATTREGDRWIHSNPEKAKELGFLF